MDRRAWQATVHMAIGHTDTTEVTKHVNYKNRCQSFAR